MSRLSSLAPVLALAVLPAFAQTPPAAGNCLQPASTAAWFACAPDRALSQEEITQHLLRPNQTMKWELTGGTSGRKFAIAFRPDGKLDMTVNGGANFGRDWKLENGRLCLRAYRNVWNGQFNCGPLELAGGKLYWAETVDGSRNLIDSIGFAAP